MEGFFLTIFKIKFVFRNSVYYIVSQHYIFVACLVYWNLLHTLTKCKSCLLILLVAPGNIHWVQKSIWIQNNYLFDPGLLQLYVKNSFKQYNLWHWQCLGCIKKIKIINATLMNKNINFIHKHTHFSVIPINRLNNRNNKIYYMKYISPKR